MNDLERIKIEHACQSLVTAYCHFVDHGQAERVADLFSEDGILSAGGVPLNGRAALAESFADQQASGEGLTKHVCNNFQCEVRDQDHADGLAYVTLYRHEPDSNGQPTAAASPVMAGKYRDAFVRTSEGSRIAKREIAVRFSSIKP